MKKVLLGTAAALAIAFAGSAHAADSRGNVKLSLGGYFTGHGVFADQDDGAGEPAVSTRDFDIQRRSEIHFKSEATLDNGLVAGAEIVLLGEPNDEQIQESYVYFAGNWGKVELGANYSAAYKMTVGSPGVDPENFDGPAPDFVLASAGTNTAAEGYVPFFNTGDFLAEKISYYTPRFNGFQLGVSYAPDAGRQGTPAGNTTTQQNGQILKGSTFAGLAGEAGAGEQSERIEAGVNYQANWAGLGWLLGATYGHADQELPDGITTTGDDDQEAWNAGVQVSWQNFTFGGGYYWDNNGASGTTTGGVEVGDGETNTWHAGVNYGVGPWLVGVNYLNSEIDTSVAAGAAVGAGTAATDELDRWVIGGNYEVGPGVKFTGTVQFHDYERSNATAANAAAGTNDATIVTLGTTVNF